MKFTHLLAVWTLSVWTLSLAFFPSFMLADETLPFVRGDCNGDGAVRGSVSDAIFLLQFNFSGSREPPCLAACDANGDGKVVGQVTDAVFVLRFNFLGGPPPEAPFPKCAMSERQEDTGLGCERSPACESCPTGLPDTGQSLCHDVEGNTIDCESVNFPGLDGFQQTGCSPANRFMDNGNGTVMDSCTGLMWQQSSAPGLYGWQEALLYAEGLVLGGFDDWRLPNIRELQSIADYGRFDPAIDPVFTDTVSDWYWSSTPLGFPPAMNPDFAFNVNFENGDVYDWRKNDSLSVRLVRSSSENCRSVLPATGQSRCFDDETNVIACDSAEWPGQDAFHGQGCPVEGRFFDNGDGTVTDNCTGLMWQKETANTDSDNGISDGDNLGWEEALRFCDRLELAGFSDWRLPNLRELHSINDFGRFLPSIAPEFEAQPLWYWSSTTASATPGRCLGHQVLGGTFPQG